MKRLIVVVLILLLTASVVAGALGWFYWFQWRPSEIRKECSNEITKLNNSGKNTAEGWFKGVIAYKPKPDNGKGITFSFSPLEVDQSQTYKNCLHYKGLE